MGTFAGNTLIDDLARRLRDTANIGYPRTVALDVINRCQRALNAHLGLVVADAAFNTVNTTLYSVPAIASNIVRIVEVRDVDDRLLTKVPWTNLVHQHPNWMRLTGPQPEMFASIGRDLLVVIPIPIVPQTLTANYVIQTADLADAGAPLIDIPDEHKSLLLDLSESVLLFRGRMFRNMQEVMRRVATALGMEDVMQMARRLENPSHE